MQVKFKSNRNLFIFMLLPIFVIVLIVIIFMSVAIIINYERQKNAIIVCIVLSCFDFLLLITMLIIKFYKGKSYIFSCSNIVMFKKNIEIEVIAIEDIQIITYRKFRLLPAILGFFGGGVYTWTLDIELKNGTKNSIGFFSQKDVRKLKSELYGDLIEII